MGWGTTFNTYIYLNRQIYENGIQVDDKLKDIQGEINFIEKKLIALIAGTHTPEDSEIPGDIATSIVIDLDETMEWYRDLIIQRYNLQLYLEHLQNTELLNKK